MERLYRFSLPVGDVERATTAPPLPPRTLGPECHWDFEERDFGQIPEFRRWCASEGLHPAEEGSVRATGKLSPDETLVLLSGSKVTTAGVDDRLSSSEVCPVCGLAVRHVEEPGTFAVDGEPPADAVLSYVPAANTFVTTTEVVRELEAEGLGSGLQTAPARAASGDYVVVYSGVAVGDPTAPFGAIGEVCPRCGRSFRRANGTTYPGVPRYSFFFVFERPQRDAQWFWSTIDGQTRVMVTPDVARWLQNRDPDLNVLTRGWSPDDLERAFLPEEYR